MGQKKRDHIVDNFNENYDNTIKIRWENNIGCTKDLPYQGKNGIKKSRPINLYSLKVIKLAKNNGNWPPIPLTCTSSLAYLDIKAQGCSNNGCSSDNCCNLKDNNCCLDNEIITEGKKNPRCTVDKDEPCKWTITPHKKTISTEDVEAFCFQIPAKNLNTFAKFFRLLYEFYSEPGGTVTIGEP